MRLHLSMKYFVPLLVMLFFMHTRAETGFAQDNNEQQQQAQQSLLPEIDPQDIEIRSQFQARFPGLRRQPILGMNPRPRVFQLDPNRMPFIESYKQVMASLPVAMLSRPEPPNRELLPFANSNTGYFSGGFGNYTSPESELYLMTGINNRNWISASADFNSTNGHLDNQESSFRFFSGEVKYLGRVTDKTLVETRVGYFNDFNHLPEIQGLNTPDFQTSRNEFDGVNFKARVTHNENSIEGIEVNMDGYVNNLEMTADPLLFNTDGDEWGVRFDGSKTWAGDRINETFSVYADLEFGSVNQSVTGGSESWNVAGVMGSYQRLFNYKTDIRADVGVYHVKDAVDNSTFYLAPRLGITHTLFNGFKLRGSVSGTPEHRSLVDFHRENRFLVQNTELQHSYTLEFLGEVIIEPVHGTKVRGGVNYSDIENRAFFTRMTQESFTETFDTFYTLNFQDATDLKIFAGVSQQVINNVFWLDAEGHWRRPRLSDNRDIPFEESISIRGALTFKPVDRIVFEGWGEFTGSRENPAGPDLDSYFLLGTRLELQVNNWIGVYGKIVNLLNQEFEVWQGYEEREFQAVAGVTILF